MATARNINFAPEIVHAVTFQYVNGVLTVSGPTFNMNGTTDTVTFSNSANSTATITLVFAANPPGGSTPPLFTFAGYPNLVLAPGATSAALAPQYLNGAVNYTVQVNGTQVGDIYGIASGSSQTGYGPVVVTVNGTTCTPETVVVPYQATILFYSTDGLKHTITWGPNAGNPVPGANHGVSARQSGGKVLHRNITCQQLSLHDGARIHAGWRVRRDGQSQEHELSEAAFLAPAALAAGVFLLGSPSLRNPIANKALPCGNSPALAGV